MKTACFTGHRPDKLGGYDAPPDNSIRQFIETALDRTIYEAYEKGVDIFITGGAMGVDQIAAGLCSFHGYQFIIIEPFTGFWSRWPEKAQKFYFALREEAADVVTLLPGPNAYQTRNEYMVNHSDVVIAVWDGSEGGTYNTVRYAELQGKPIYRIDPLSKSRGWFKTGK